MLTNQTTISLQFLGFFLHNQFQKGGRDLISKEMMFQRAGAMAEKADVLGPVKWNLFTDETCNIPLLPDPICLESVIGEK